MPVNLGYLEAFLGLNTTQLMVGLTRARTALKTTGKQMTAIGRSMSTALTLPLAIMGGAAIKTFADFESAMNNVRAVTGSTMEEFKQLEGVARTLGSTTKFTAVQAAEGMSFLAMAGFEVNEIMKAIPTTLNLAAAGNMELARAADIVSNVMQGFGIEAERTTEVADVLTKTFTSSNTSLEQIGEAMAYAAPVAKAFSQSLATTSAAMGMLGDAGIQGSRAGTAMRQMLLQLDKKSKKLGINIRDRHGDFKDLADILLEVENAGIRTDRMVSILGPRAGVGMAALMDRGSEALRDFAWQVDNAGNITEQIAEVQMQGLKGAFIEMKSAMSELAIAFGDVLGGSLEALVDWFKELLVSWSKLDVATKKIIIAIGSFALALGPAIFLVGKLVLLLAALASPVGIAIAALVALGAAILYIWDNWEAIIERISDWSWWKNMLISMIQFLIKWNPFSLMIKGYNALVGAFGGDPLPNIWEDMAEGLEGLKDETKEYEHQFGSFMDAIKAGYEKAKGWIDGIMPSGGGGAADPTTKVTQRSGFKAPDKKFAFGTEDYQAVYGKGLIPGLKETEEDLKRVNVGFMATQDSALNLGEAMQTALNTAFVELGETLGEIFSGDGGASNFFEGIVSIIAGFMKTLGQAAIAAGVAGIAFQNLISNPWALLAAGVALVALSTVLRNVMKKGPEGLASGGFVKQGGVFKVGEKGEELVTLPRGSAVTPNNMARGGTGTLTGRIEGSGETLLVIVEEAKRRRDNVNG